MLCSWVEKSEHASNYRGEILGKLGYLLVMKAVLLNRRDVSDNSVIFPQLVAVHDNMGVIKHGRKAMKPLKSTQVQADVLGHMKFLSRSLEMRTKFVHVHSHMDKVLKWHEMTPEQQFNKVVDNEADQALKYAVKHDEYIRSEWPFMRVIMKCGQTLVTGSPTEAIYDWNGRKLAKQVYPKVNIIQDEAHFELIYWKGIGTLLKERFTPSYATFYTKHIMGFCGVRHHLHNIDESIPNICPCCGQPDETTDHIILCPDEGRTELYKKSVNQLINWMRKEDTDPMLTQMVQKYLRARKTKTMKEVFQEIGIDNHEGWLLACEHDEIGWKCFVEGRISARYVLLQRERVVQSRSYSKIYSEMGFEVR